VKATTAVLVLLVGCSKTEPTTTEHATPSASPAAPRPPSPPEARTVNFALAAFDGPENRLLVCTDVRATPEQAAALQVPEGMTRLSKPCDSLGHPPLCTCTFDNLVEHYYRAEHSDSYQPNCAQRGGRWDVNHGAEAEAERAAQATHQEK